MIIHPSFFTHWKVKALVDLTKRPESPLWIQQLWAHCQVRKTSVFSDLSPLAIKSICGVHSDFTPEQWKTILIDTGFIKESGRKVIVCNWDEYNSSLISKWQNGKAEKRQADAKRSLSGQQAVTKRTPSGHPADEERNQDSLADRTTVGGGDRIGLDRIGQDRTGEETNPDRFVLQIYEAYPRHEGKQHALRMIKRALSSIAPDLLLERVTTYAAAVAQWPREYRYAAKTGRDTVPNPGTWFNEGRYDDDPALWLPRKNNRDGVGAATPPFDPTRENAHTGGLAEFTPEDSPMPATHYSLPATPSQQ